MAVVRTLVPPPAKAAPAGPPAGPGPGGKGGPPARAPQQAAPAQNDAGRRSDFQDLAAALRGEQRKEEPLPSKNQWESGSARVPEQRLRKLLVEAQHPEVSRVKGCAYIALTEFVKVVGAVPLPILDEAKAAKKRKVEAPKVAAGGQGGGGGGKGKGGQAPDVWQHCERSSARERQSSAARTWVQKYWARQKNAAMTENPARVKAEELDEQHATTRGSPTTVVRVEGLVSMYKERP